jgi:prevent-host-death family protein
VRRLSATEVARRFSDVVNRVRYQNEVVIVERGKEPVCEIGPVESASPFTGADLVALLRSLPPPGEEYLEAVAKGIRKQPTAQETRWRR